MSDPNDTTGGNNCEKLSGVLMAAKVHGAHDEFIAFVAEYPDSSAAETLETAISLNALDDFPGFAGSFVGSLWAHGAAGAGNPDRENGQRIRDLFPKDRWPQWMQQYHDDGKFDDGNGNEEAEK